MKVEIEKGVLTIAVPVGALATAAPYAFDKRWGYEQHGLTVTDENAFAREVLRQLRKESEDGTTVVHLMLDKAMCDVCEDGGEGVEQGSADQTIPVSKDGNKDG